MSKFYTPAWKERGLLFEKIIEAASDKLNAAKIYKEGRNTDEIYSREITPKDWMTKSGYRVKVWSQDEKAAQDTDSLQKLNAVKVNMPDNPKLLEVYQRKLLEFASLTPDEINQIMEFEDKKREALTSAVETGIMGMGQPPIAPGQGQPTMPAQQPAQMSVQA